MQGENASLWVFYLYLSLKGLELMFHSNNLMSTSGATFGNLPYFQSLYALSRNASLMAWMSSGCSIMIWFSFRKVLEIRFASKISWASCASKTFSTILTLLYPTLPWSCEKSFNSSTFSYCYSFGVSWICPLGIGGCGS